jgi:ribosomal protein L13
MKEETFEFKLKKNPEKAFKDSVRGMLAKNSLRDKRLKHLIIKQ